MELAMVEQMGSFRSSNPQPSFHLSQVVALTGPNSGESGLFEERG